MCQSLCCSIKNLILFNCPNALQCVFIIWQYLRCCLFLWILLLWCGWIWASMEKLTRRFKRNRSKEMSSSLDFLSFGGLCDEHMQHREENCLRRLTFSSVSVGVLPVFLARARTACETESLVRASSSISVLTPTELNHGSSMESAVTFPQSFQLPTMPGSAVPKCPFSRHITSKF